MQESQATTWQSHLTAGASQETAHGYESNQWQRHP